MIVLGYVSTHHQPYLLPYHVTQISVAGVSPGRERPDQLLGSCGKGRGSAAILVRMML